jgi:hypothetical protein
LSSLREHYLFIAGRSRKARSRKENRKVGPYGGVAEIIGSPIVDGGTAVAKVY